MIVYVYMYYMLVRLSVCLNHIKGMIIIIIIINNFYTITLSMFTSTRAMIFGIKITYCLKRDVSKIT